MEFVVETTPDMEATAKLAKRAFGRADPSLNANRFRWTYGPGYDGAIVLAAIKDGEKVGQGSFIFQEARIAGLPVRAAQFVDLFVDPDHRGGSTVRGLYRALLEQAQSEDVGFIFATPNPAARVLNKRLMGLENLIEIPFRIGVARPFGPGRSVRSLRASELAGKATEEIAPYCQPSQDTAIVWSPAALARRLTHPNHSYSVHFTEESMLVASPRKTRGMPLFLALGFMIAEGHVCGRAESRTLLRAAAAFHRRPFFAYAGVNSTLAALPGFVAPDRIKPPILVQGRNLREPGQPVAFERCELLDFDWV